MNTQTPIFYGELAIQKALGGVSRVTVHNWRRKYGLPVFRAPDGGLAMLQEDFVNWCHARLAIQKATGRLFLKPTAFRYAEYLDRAGKSAA